MVHSSRANLGPALSCRLGLQGTVSIPGHISYFARRKSNEGDKCMPSDELSATGYHRSLFDSNCSVPNGG